MSQTPQFFTLVQLASDYHDIETVKFLLKNSVGLNNLSIIFYKAAIEQDISPFMAALTNWRKKSFFDQELIELLFDNGLDLNKEIDGSTVYYHIISSSPEEFSIKMLDRISDLNRMQQECIGYLNENKEEVEELVPASYLQKAIFSERFELAIAMIENGAEIKKGQELELLYSAVEKNNINFIQYLFENGHIPTLENLKGTETLLAKALLHNNYETFMLLVKKGANIEAKCDSYIYIKKDGILDIKSLYAPTIFAQLIKQAPEDVVFYVLQLVNIDVNAKLVDKYSSCTYETNNQDSYLHIALREKKYDVAKKLIELGSDINLPFNGTTPIHIVLDNGELEFAKYLVKKGVDTSYTARDCEKNALQKALDSGNVDLADFIVKKAADAKKMLTFALADAIYLQDVTKVKLLLSMGADVREIDSIFYRAKLINQINYGNSDRIIKTIDEGVALDPVAEDPELSKMLISIGTNINSLRMIWGQSPLIEAISHAKNYTHFSRKDLCQKLVEAGAEVNKADYNGSLPLITACRDSVLTEYLISIGADVNVIDNCGRTPLTAAIYNNEPKVLKLLLDAGADVNVIDNCGCTPLTAAISSNRPEMLKLLLDADADVNFNPENGGPDVWFWCKHNYECAKIIVASGKLKLEGRSEYEIQEYNQIKTKVEFEQKALADIEVIKTAYTECNEDSIKDSFVYKKIADSMLKYYLHGYKSKFKEQIEGTEGEFFTDLADTVVKHLKIYTQYNWPQIFGIAKTLVINNSSNSQGDALNIPKEIIGEIGEYVFWHDVLDSNSS